MNKYQTLKFFRNKYLQIKSQLYSKPIKIDMTQQSYQFILEQQIFQQFGIYQDFRSKEDKLAAVDNINKLSKINMQRLSNRKSKLPQINKKIIRKQDCLYVCLHGLPFFYDEFAHLKLPGSILQIKYTPMQQEISLEAIKDHPCSFQSQAKRMHQKINSISKTKPIIFVYHSFGTFIMSSFIHLYPQQTQRVIGMIDIAGTNFRSYNLIKPFYYLLSKYSLQEIYQRIGQVYGQYKNICNSLTLNYFLTPQSFFSFCKTLKPQGITYKLYSLQKKWPHIIKCFIYTNKDHIFALQSQSEKINFYTYQTKFKKEYQLRLQSTWFKLCDQKVDNIQEKFIFQIEGGSHSFHLQKRNSNLLQNIIGEYLQFLQILYDRQSSKL